MSIDPLDGAMKSGAGLESAEAGDEGAADVAAETFGGVERPHAKRRGPAARAFAPSSLAEFGVTDH